MTVKGAFGTHLILMRRRGCGVANSLPQWDAAALRPYRESRIALEGEEILEELLAGLG
jgi:hypothetical protein